MMKKLLLSSLLIAPAMCLMADETPVEPAPIPLLPEGITHCITDAVQPQKATSGGLVVAGSPEKGYKAYFFANDANDTSGTGPDLWATDGTPEGTYRVKDLRTKGTASSNPLFLTRFGDKVIFTAADGIHGNQPWISDGTEEGTHMLKDMCPGSNGYQSYARGYTQLDETHLVFASQYNVTTSNNKLTDYPLYLFVTDGTEEGTQCIAEIKCQWPGKANDANTRVDPWCRVGRKVFFKAISLDGASGEELFVTDGTAEGTKMVKDINVSATVDHTTSAITFFTNYHNEKLIFRAYKSPYSHEPWISDGTDEGTKLIYDIHPDKNGNGAMAFPTFNFVDSYCYFRCTTPETGSEFGRVNIDAFLDGEENFFEIYDINQTDPTATNASTPGPSYIWGGLVWFSANGGTDVELHTFDPATKQVALYKEMEPEGKFGPKEMTACAGSLYVVNLGSGKAVNKSALWRIDDPTTGELVQVTNFEGSNADGVCSPRNLNGTMLFAASPNGNSNLYAYTYRKPGYNELEDADMMEPEYRTRKEIEEATVTVEGVIATDGNIKATVSPNPASSIARIKAEGEIIAVSVYNLQGVEVLAANEAEINVANLSAGLYLVRVTTDAGTAVARMIKK